MPSALTLAHSERSHLALVTRSSSALAESADAYQDRRGSVRRTIAELSWLSQVRLKYGPAVSLIDLSSGGAQIETAGQRLQPGGSVVVEIAAGSDTFCIPSLVVGAYVSGLSPTTTYRSRLSFKRPFEFPVLQAANTADTDRDLNLSHEHARLNVALRRLDDAQCQGGQCGVAHVGRGALAAALAILESPSGRRAGAMFSREMSRLFRILSAGITDGTAPATMLTQLVDALRRAIPSQVIRVVPGESFTGASPEAICFTVPSPDGGCAGQLVVELPRGGRLEPEHHSLLKAAAHLVTVVNQIDVLLHSRERASADESPRDLPAGWKRLVVRYLDGRLLKGYNADFSAAKEHVHVWMVPNGPDASRITVTLAHLKALFFVHDLDGDPVQLARGGQQAPSLEHGRRVDVTFSDGEMLSGTTLNYSADGPGFFVTPLAGTGNNLRIFVTTRGVQHVTFP
jgi:hypothetical protein